MLKFLFVTVFAVAPLGLYFLFRDVLLVPEARSVGNLVGAITASGLFLTTLGLAEGFFTGFCRENTDPRAALIVVGLIFGVGSLLVVVAVVGGGHFDYPHPLESVSDYKIVKFEGSSYLLTRETAVRIEDANIFETSVDSLIACKRRFYNSFGTTDSSSTQYYLMKGKECKD
jgi:hypothetical protein